MANRELLEQAGIGDIVKGADHSSQVAQGRTFDAAFAQWSRGLAFKISDHKIPACVQHLAKVKITVNTNAHSRNASLKNSPQLQQHLAFKAHNFRGLFSRG